MVLRVYFGCFEFLICVLSCFSLLVIFSSGNGGVRIIIGFVSFGIWFVVWIFMLLRICIVLFGIERVF